jgi:hypothetical protein
LNDRRSNMNPAVPQGRAGPSVPKEWVCPQCPVSYVYAYGIYGHLEDPRYAACREYVLAESERRINARNARVVTTLHMPKTKRANGWRAEIDFRWIDFSLVYRASVRFCESYRFLMIEEVTPEELPVATASPLPS